MNKEQAYNLFCEYIEDYNKNRTVGSTAELLIKEVRPNIILRESKLFSCLHCVMAVSEYVKQIPCLRILIGYDEKGMFYLISCIYN